jgi:hypothetical protein
MLTALVLICSVEVSLEDCTRNNATTVMRVPTEFGNPQHASFRVKPTWRGAQSGASLMTVSGSR